MKIEHSKTYLIIWILTIITTFLLISVFNWVVDPYWIYWAHPYKINDQHFNKPAFGTHL